MRGFLLFLASAGLLATATQAQNVGIGTTSPAASAALDVSSTNKGLLPPRLTQAQRDAITSPAAGLTIYNTTAGALNVWSGSQWAEVLGAERPPGFAPVTFGYSGSPAGYTVPAGVTSIRVTATGGRGGAGGGLATQVQATLTVVPGELLVVVVGSAGGNPIPGGTPIPGSNIQPPRSGSGGYNGGGGGGVADVNGGGGGGATALQRNTRQGATGDYLTSRNALLVAAGGGGGYLSSTGPSSTGGAGGLPSPGGTSSGAGATQVGPGAGAAGLLSNGQNGTGGSSIGGGGGGGGGYYGGGGGFQGGGGGGSSFVTPIGSGTVSYAATGAGDGSLTIAPGQLGPAPVLDGSNITGVIKNQEALQAGANFNIDGNGGVGGVLTVAGNLGLGTASPTARLDVRGNQQLVGTLQFNTADGDKLYLTSAGTVGSKLGHAPGWGLASYAGPGTGSQGYHAWLLSGASTYQEGMRLTSTGLGVGTTSPSQLLEMSGQAAPTLLLHSTGNNLVSGATLQFREANATYGWNLRHNNGGSEGGSTNDRLVLESDNGGTPTPVMVWDQNSGYVGIGTTVPGTPLDVSGAVRCTNLIQTSDQRFKQAVRPLTGALASVQRLRAVRYRWNALGVAHGGVAGAEQVGLLAQELEKVYPELVSTDAQGYKAVNYAQLTPVLLEALQELTARNAALEAQLAAQQRTAQAQQANLTSLDQRLRALEAAGAQASK